jgi:hypothetical protein
MIHKFPVIWDHLGAWDSMGELILEAVSINAISIDLGGLEKTGNFFARSSFSILE